MVVKTPVSKCENKSHKKRKELDGGSFVSFWRQSPLTGGLPPVFCLTKILT